MGPQPASRHASPTRARLRGALLALPLAALTASTPPASLAAASRAAAAVPGLAPVPATAVAPAPDKQDLFDEIYRRSAPIEGSLKTIKAHFVEETSSSLLAKPLIAEGTLEARRPSDLLLTYTKPEKKTIRVDATTLSLIWPDRGMNEQRDIAQSQKRVQQYFVNKSPDELRKHFAIVATEDTARPGTYRLAMTPKRKQILQGVAKLDLWLAKDTFMLAAMRMTFPNGDSKTMTFDHVEMNVPVNVK